MDTARGMLAGQVVDGRFVVEGVVGQGGMARIYSALDKSTGERVALKVLLDGVVLDDPENRDRFDREADILASLVHPGIVRYVAHGIERGVPYIAMEWVAGETLGRYLQRQTLSIADAVRLLLRMSEALSVAHEKGIVHRDLKPGNVILLGGQIEMPKLLDFGVARLAKPQKELTRRGVLLGSMGYMAPEQARGSLELDARADVFALGCLLLHALTGKRLFEGSDSLAYLVRVVVDDAPRLRTLRADAPVWLETLLARMLARSADERPRDAGVLAQELRKLSSIELDEATVEVDDSPSSIMGTLGAFERRVHCVLLVRPPEREGGVEDAKNALERAAAKLEGTLDELLDGHLLVSFPGSGAATDEATRAAKCALAFEGMIEGERTAIVAAESAGETPLGATFQAVLPMLERAALDVIAVDDVTAGLLGARFDVGGDEHGLYLLGERDVGEAARTLLGKPTPCVGRDAELSAIRAVVEEAERARKPAAVIITGEAGIGKSRVRHEVFQWLESRGKPVEIWIGQGDPMSAGSSFGLLSRALRRAANVTAGEPLEVARRKVRARVGRHLDPVRAASVAEFLGEIAGTPFEEAGRPQLAAARRNAMLMGDRIRRAFTDFVAAESRKRTLVIVLEDLHFGDLPSINLVEAALGEPSALVVLGLGRPDLLRQFPELWSSRSPRLIHLGPLTQADSQKLVRGALGARAKSAVVAEIAEHAGGNAFFLEELVRAAAKGREQTLPESVIAMVQGTLEELEPRARKALRAASIFGDVFTETNIAALVGESPREVTTLLLSLCQREILEQREVSLTRHDGFVEMFSFRHAYVREAAYAMLTEEDRLLGHKLAARHLASAGEPDPTRLAEHFWRAGEQEKAAGYFMRAAEQALEGNDLGRAIENANKGIACGALGEERGQLLLIRSEAHRWRGENIPAMQSAELALSALPRESDTYYAAVSEVASCAIRTGALDSLLAVSNALREIVSAAGMTLRPAQIAACARVATALFMFGKHSEADAILEFAKRPLKHEPSKDTSQVAPLLEAEAMRAYTVGDLASAIPLAEKLITVFHEMGDVRSVARHRSNQGVALNAVGAYADAERSLRLALAAAEPLGLFQVVCAIQQNLGFSLAHSGRLDEAQTLLSRSIRDAVLQRNRRLEAGARIYLAIAAFYGRKLDIADAEATAAAEALRGSPLEAYALGVRAYVELLRSRPDEALRTATQALALLNTQGGTAEEGEGVIRLAYAEALAAMGDAEGARVAISGAVRRLEERARAISQPEWRHSFLEIVPEHRRTFELAAQLGLIRSVENR